MSGTTARRFARALRALACLVPCLLGALLPADSTVLCMEPRGGVGIEAGYDAACCTSSAQPAPGAADHAQCNRSSCPCIDVPLASAAEARRDPLRANFTGADERSASAPGDAPHAPSALAANARVLAARCGQAAPSPAVQRSVVLLV